jgi:hypothetical protein
LRRINDLRRAIVDALNEKGPHILLMTGEEGAVRRRDVPQMEQVRARPCFAEPKDLEEYMHFGRRKMLLVQSLVGHNAA